jgi:hypothetical protein
MCAGILVNIIISLDEAEAAKGDFSMSPRNVEV